MEQAKKDRINELAALAEQRPLTEEEKAEQAALRAEYIAEFRAYMRATLDNTVIERPDGSREKLTKKDESED
jgi:uncharacterized protein YnzC (UPF0291/DUF896 family)